MSTTSRVQRWPDGSAAWPVDRPHGKWVAKWSDGSMLTGEDERTGQEGTCYFASLADAAAALTAGGEGPAGTAPRNDAKCPACGRVGS